MRGGVKWQLGRQFARERDATNRTSSTRLWRTFQLQVMRGRKPGNDDIQSLLRVLASVGDVKKVRSVIASAQEMGIPMKAEWYVRCIDAMAKKGMHSCIADAVESVVRSFDRSLSVPVVNYALETLGTARMYKYLEKVLQSMRRKKLEPTAETFNSLMYASIASKDYESTLNLFTEMLHRNLEVTPLTASYVIVAYDRRDDLKTAIAEFERLRSAGVRYTVTVYNSMCFAYARRGDIQSGLGLLQEMSRSKVDPNSTTFRILVDECAKRRLFDRGTALYEAVLGLLNEQRLKPTTTLLNSFLHLFSQRKEDLPRATACAEVLHSTGAAMNSMSYGLLIQAYGRSGKVEMAGKVLSKMKQAGLHPCAATFNGLIMCHGHRGDVESAMVTFETMARSGIEPDINTCNSLILACVRSGRGRDAVGVFEKMMDRGVQPNLKTFVALVESGNAPPIARQAFVEHRKKNGRLPSAYAYDALINLYLKSNELQNALDAFREMMAHDVVPRGSSANALTTALITNGRVESAVEIYEEMRRVSATPAQKVTVVKKAPGQELRDMVHTLSSMGPAHRPREKPRKVFSDFETFSNWINELADANDVSGATQLTHSLRRFGVAPDVMMYNSLLRAHAVAIDVDGFLSTFEDMCREGVATNKTTFAVAHELRRASGDDRLTRTLSRLCRT